VEIILERIDQLAYVFIVAPFCYNTQQMYEKIKHSICVILQLIKSQQKDSKLNSDDEDFMSVLSETFTKLCVRLLIQNNFIEMKECVATSSACMTRKPRCAYQVFLNKHDLQHDSLLSHSSYIHMYI